MLPDTELVGLSSEGLLQQSQAADTQGEVYLIANVSADFALA